MTEIQVEIVTLPAMRCVRFHGFGPSPEGLAFEKARKWLEAVGLWERRRALRFFGFNNPDPSPGSPNYGYEVWVTAEPAVTLEGTDGQVAFPGGLYAMTRVEAGPKGEGIFETWQALAGWVEDSPYTPEFHSRPCLEESPDPFGNPGGGFTLLLHEPVRA